MYYKENKYLFNGKVLQLQDKICQGKEKKPEQLRLVESASYVLCSLRVKYCLRLQSK